MEIVVVDKLELEIIIICIIYFERYELFCRNAKRINRIFTNLLMLAPSLMHKGNAVLDALQQHCGVKYMSLLSDGSSFVHNAEQYLKKSKSSFTTSFMIVLNRS